MNMRTIFAYLFCLLSLVARPASGQGDVVTKAQPPYPQLPYKVTYSTPQEGSLSIFLPGSETASLSGTEIYIGTPITLQPLANSGYQAALGYPKAYKTDEKNVVVPITTDPASARPVFVMPAFPVTVEMKYDEVLSNDTRLKAISYQVNDASPVPIPGFSNATTLYEITLPAGTTGTVSFSTTATDDRASVTVNPASPITLTDGKGEALVTVKAADGKTTKTFTIRFTVAQPATKIIRISSAIGGTVAVYYTDEKTEKTVFVKSGDAVAETESLSLQGTALSGYTFGSFTNNGIDFAGDRIAVSSVNGELSARFTKKNQGEDVTLIGTEAKPEETPETPIPTPTTDGPIVIIPDAAALPENTELSELRLIKHDDVPEVLKEAVEQQATSAGIEKGNIEIAEIALVKIVTTIDGSSGETSTEITPVQPSDIVKVRIAYPESTADNKGNLDFTVFHLRMDGSTETYTEGKGLTLKDDYMELTVASFSPFGIAWKTKSDPDPGPDPDPTSYYSVTLPVVEGILFDQPAGIHEVEAGQDFVFALTLKDGYKLYSRPVLHTDRDNNPLEPRASDGHYVIEQVDRDIIVRISGIVDDNSVPTGNATVDQGLYVQVIGSTLYISSDRPEQVNIFSLSGQTVRRFVAQAGSSEYRLPSGIYLIRIGTRQFKAIIR